MYQQRHPYFDKVPEVEKANEDYQLAIKKFLNKEITLEECAKYQQAVFNACNEFGWYASKRNIELNKKV